MTITDIMNKELVNVYATGYNEYLDKKVEFNLPHLSFYEYVDLCLKNESMK